jgi:antitoxin component YwqK of YwqJK toxin-antitoxin module
MDNLRLNENNQFLFKEPTNFQFNTWGRKLKKCQYKSIKDINSPLYLTFDSGSEQGVIINGYKEGVWTEYYDNSDQRKSVGSYINSKKDGKWVEFDNLGLVTNEVSYVMGEIVTNNENKLNNKELINDPEVIKEPQFETPDIYLSFENLLQINGIYFDPIKNIPITIDYKSGNYLGKITNGYINEYPDTWTKLDENGNIEYIGYFNKNNRDGDWIFYQNNSIYEQGSYSEGLKTDFWIKYYPNGNVLSRGEYS